MTIASLVILTSSPHLKLDWDVCYNVFCLYHKGSYYSGADCVIAVSSDFYCWIEQSTYLQDIQVSSNHIEYLSYRIMIGIKNLFIFKFFQSDI